jgi:hypothetical protein
MANLSNSADREGIGEKQWIVCLELLLEYFYAFLLYFSEEGRIGILRCALLSFFPYGRFGLPLLNGRDWRPNSEE